MNRIAAVVTLAVLSAGSRAAHAGPYAALAARVRANGGVIQVVAMGGLETQAAATLDATAVGACHTMAAEGVTVTTVQIVTQAGQVIRVVTGAALTGC